MPRITAIETAIPHGIMTNLLFVRVRTDDGLVADAGKFLRTSRYDRGGFTPGVWRGTSVPTKPSRGIYFATHFFNYYHSAPVAEIERYVEDLALWGTNELLVWYDMHHFNGFDDPAAVAFRVRLRSIALAAKRIGMDVSLLVIGNEAYGDSPAQLRAAGRGRGGQPDERCNAAFAELIRIYHAQDASATIRPPLPMGWKPTPERESR